MGGHCQERQKQLLSHRPVATLAGIRAGGKVRLVGIDAGCNLQGRLLALGLVKGAQITVISNAGRGPLLIGLGESRMTLGRGMAEKILVA